MRILVTGGAGFIGSHVCESLVRRGDEVTVLDNFNDTYDPRIKRRNLRGIDDARVVEGDIRDPGLVRALFDSHSFGAVVHLAALAGVRRSLEDPLAYSDVNVRGTQVLLRELERRPETRLVFASSSSVYGANSKVPFREDDPVGHPLSPYAATKRAGELLCYTHHHLYGTPVTCLRFFTVYGPRQRPEMAIHKFVRKCLAGEPIPFFGDGSSRRDYTYIDDIVEGVLGALERDRDYAIYNLGESRTISLAELVEAIGEACGVQPILDPHPPQPGDVPLTYADVSLARKELGYEPRVGLEEGLARFMAWYRDQHAAGLGAGNPVP